MRNPFVILLVIVLIHHSSYGSSELKIRKVPSWVNAIGFMGDMKGNRNEGYRYLLIDLQDHVDDEWIFRHYAFEVLNADGVQEMSTINVSFDPTYQQLFFHHIDIIRDGKRVNRLAIEDFQVIQREVSMERSLYDGSLSAILNLSDVKIGDIIEYSYSIKGFNPLYEGHYSMTFYHNYSIPIDRIYNRVVSEREIYLDLKNNAYKPLIESDDKILEYIWDIKNESLLLYDTNVPSWYIAQKFVKLSSFKDWKSVSEWYYPLYNYDQDEFSKVLSKTKTPSSEPLKSRIRNHIRFVQDNIRYLGFESGIGAHKPNSPDKVLEQGYGDCKDKSLLLVALLRNEKVNAYPVLVNTIYGEVIDDWIPSHGAFDHCVVAYSLNDSLYFVDPTISNQGGDIGSLFFPAYKNGLIVREGTSELEKIPNSDKGSISIKEVIEVDEIGGNAHLTVRSEYTGERADYIRSDFNSSSIEALQKNYLDYYSGLYPDIESLEELKFLDYDRNTFNKVIVEEEYLIKNFWQNSDDQSYIYADTYPMVLESLINYTSSAGGDMPYYVGKPLDFEQNIIVILPEDWSVTPEKEEISGEAFKYSYTTSGKGNKVFVNHKYELNQAYIDGREVPDFLRKHDEIQANLSFILTYGKGVFSGGEKLSWLSILLAMIALCGGIFFAMKLYNQFDPIPWGYAENTPIGGWLILPAIGITISPIVIILEMIQADFFDYYSWSNLLALETNNLLVTALFAAEIICNILFIVFTVTLIILFYQRRTSVPRLITIFYALNLILPVIDHFLVESLQPGLLTDEDISSNMRNFGRSFIGAAIWIPYFTVSERVKSTFCKTTSR